MQQRRHRRSDHSEEAQRKQSRIKGQNKSVIRIYPFHEPLTEHSQNRKLGQLRVPDRDIRSLLRNVGGVAHCN